MTAVTPPPEAVELTRRLRLLVISSYLPGVGGGELQTALQVRTLAERGHGLRVFDIGSNPGAPSREVLDGILVQRIRGPNWPLLEGMVAQVGLFLRLLRLLPGLDLVQFNHLGPALVTTRLLTGLFRVSRFRFSAFKMVKEVVPLFTERSMATWAI